MLGNPLELFTSSYIYNKLKELLSLLQRKLFRTNNKNIDRPNNIYIVNELYETDKENQLIMMDKYLIINSGENLESKLLRVSKRTTLTLKPGPRFLAPEVSIKTNYPIKKGTKFNRDQYHDLPITSDHQDSISSSFNWSAILTLEIAGTFSFICSTSENNNEIWQAFVIVEPEIKIPLNSIRCQTVLSKNLGPLKEWRKRLTISKESRYNMIHFTPIQELGGSNSAYAIKDQHKLNPIYKANLDDVKKEVDFMEKKWNTLSITDIVLNHTADDSLWIKEHPECGYNVHNSPHLRPAFLLDSAFIWLAKDMESGVLEKTVNLTNYVNNETDVQVIGVLLKTFYVAQLKIHELFTVNVGSAIGKFKTLTRGDYEVDYGQYERNQAQVKSIPSDIIIQDDLIRFLNQKNLEKRHEVKGMLDYAINNALNAIRYERLNPEGPYFGQPVCAEKPLVAPYFSHTPYEEFKIAREESLMYGKSGEKFLAHNGWVMGAQTESTQDFASSSSQVYLKRELIAWGDNIKLRYGSGPKEVAFLWDYMRKYVEAQAKVFHGFRIDNCHSTPLHVAEYMIDAARAIRPDIYIMAELFTSSEDTDNLFVNRLGITSLVRESMSAHNSRELGRLIYRFGGTPVGAFYQHGLEHLRPDVANAIFYDQTHDNDSPIVKRSAYDISATTSLINMANCATGSNRGHDELVPHHINVVTEERLYSDTFDETSGILGLRRLLNGPLQRELSQGFTEIFVDQVNEDVIAVTRHNPVTGHSIILVARTQFSKHPGPCHMEPITIEGVITRIIFEAQAYGDPGKFDRDPQIINGLASFKAKIFSSNCGVEECKLAKLINGLPGDKAQLQFNEFQFLPSSVLAVQVSLSERQTSALKYLNEFQLDLSKFSFSISDANYILFRCSQEDGLEPYELPNLCKFTYSGLYGLMYHLEKVRRNQDQAHPLAENLRKGNWMSQYIVARLKRRPSTCDLGELLEAALNQVDLLPRGMVPKYFDLIITKLYDALLELIYSRMSVFVAKGPRLVKLLALSSVALVGECESAPMPAVETKLTYVPSIAAGLPHFAAGYMRNWGRDTFIALRGLLLITGRFSEAKSVILSYASTLKHGLIPNLLDGGHRPRYNCRDAVWWWLYSVREYTKLAPNGSEILRQKVRRIHRPELSSAELTQRKRSVAKANGYNGSIGGGGSSSLGGTNGDSHSQHLYDVIQEALAVHFKGTEFVEENAGKQLDEYMKEEGFKITIGVDRDTGFVFGGNRFNCGTWMDKMGSSEKAETLGLPASPRDGSAIEIIGLCKAVVTWLDEASKNRLYPYDGIECLYDNTITLKWTWKKWSSMLQANFEKYFYIPLADEKPLMEDPSADMINRRGIYKDSLGASLRWQDYQLRPNFLVAMVVAPELFDKRRAQNALNLAKKHLCGPLGMKTLDPSDWNYRGDYDNGNDTADPKIAHGYNYHQGPEWLWLTGYYIRASSKFLGSSERPHHLKILSNFYATLVETPWLGLPELTNSNGKFCPDSCPIQAWSLGTALEALQESVRGS